ncbi:uncharacterized protein LOC144376351 isoform X3 [Ictidomys tridecemlineatus]
MKLWSLIPQADRVKQSRGLRKYSSGPTHSLCVCLSRPVCVDRSTSLGGSRNEANQLAPCGVFQGTQWSVSALQLFKADFFI